MDMQTRCYRGWLHVVGALVFCLLVVGCASVESEWSEAQRAASVQGYRKFLTKHPTGEFADAARRAIAQLDFAKAKAAGTITALEGYLRTYPGSSNDTEASHLLEMALAAIPADGQPRIQALAALRAHDPKSKSLADLDEGDWTRSVAGRAFDFYLACYPDGRHRVEAAAQVEKSKLDDRAWRTATFAATEESFRAYLEAWPDGRHVKEKSKLDDRAWQRTTDAETAEPFRAYLEHWPDGQHLSDAKAAIVRHDELAWHRAATFGSVESLQAYLAKWSNGLHVAEAKERLAKAPIAIEGVIGNSCG